jgi:hypothetical protein
MELKSMLLPEKKVTFDFPGCEGFKIDLCYLSRESNQAILKKCQRTVIDPKSRQPKDEFDDELFLQLYVNAIIKGWTGLKLKYLKELVLVDIPEDKEDEELDYSESNAIDLMKNSTVLDGWVTDMLKDLENFTKSNSTEKSKKSSPTSKSQAQD